MMNSTVVIPKISQVHNEIKKNYIPFTFFIVFFVSMLIGASCICYCNDSSYFGIKEIFNDFYLFVSKSGFSSIFAYNFFIYFSVLFLMFIVSTSFIGFVLIFFIDFFVAFNIGITSGYLYSDYSLNGICFYALLILPGMFLFSVLSLLASNRVFIFSRRIFKNSFSQTGFSLKKEFKAFSLKFSFYFGCLVLISIIQSFLINSFIVYFRF